MPTVIITEELLLHQNPILYE